MQTTLVFWRQQPGAAPSPAAIALELNAGNEVDRLIDLPVREILERLKESFPDAVERAGELVWRREEEAFEATWTWQHVRVDCQDLSEETRGRLLAILDAFDCPAYDTQLGIRLAH
jgi:hypothetical protein